MKLKAAPLILAAAALALAVAGCGYLSVLNARTKLLENRLTLLEFEIKNARPTAAAALTPPAAVASFSQGSGKFVVVPLTTSAEDANPLEARVEQLEQEMTPHLEYLPLAK